MDRDAWIAGIVIASALFFLYFLPTILKCIRVWLKANEEKQDAAEHSFVCPCCGERFFADWRRINLSQLEMWGKIRIKCPKCHETDWCRWTRKDDF